MKLKTLHKKKISFRLQIHTVIGRLHHQGIRVRRSIKRSQLTLRHRHARFDWSHDHLGWTIRTWRPRYFWPVRLPSRTYKSNLQSKEKQPQTVTPPPPKAVVPSYIIAANGDGRARAWHQRNTSFQDNHILGTTAFGGGGVTVWDCFSLDCKLDLYVLPIKSHTCSIGFMSGDIAGHVIV
jgi:hypothetical protein